MIAPDWVMDTEATLPRYDAAWFVAFFAQIDESLWCTHRYIDSEGRCCAMGHLGVRNDVNTGRGDLLRRLLSNIAGINDGYYVQCPHPKQRVIAALRALISPTP